MYIFEDVFIFSFSFSFFSFWPKLSICWGWRGAAEDKSYDRKAFYLMSFRKDIILSSLSHQPYIVNGLSKQKKITIVYESAVHHRTAFFLPFLNIFFHV